MNRLSVQKAMLAGLALMINAGAGAYVAGDYASGWGQQCSGRVISAFGDVSLMTWRDDGVVDLLVDNLGATILVGTVRDEAEKAFRIGLQKLDPAGKPAPGFGSPAGFAVGKPDSRAEAATFDAQGQVVVSSFSELCRFDADTGQPLHFEFSASSCVKPWQGKIEASAYDIAVQPDGKFVLAGRLPDSDAFVARVLPNGTLDTTFNPPAGFLTLRPAGYSSLQFTSVKIAGNGKILAAGTGYRTADSRRIPYLARFSANGQVEAWPPQQLTLPQIGISEDNEFRDLVVIDNPQSAEDDVVAVGTAYNALRGLITRYNGQNGAVSYRVLLPLGGTNWLTFSHVDLGLNGTLLATSDMNTAAVARFLPSLMLDTSFGNGGFRVLEHDNDGGNFYDGYFSTANYSALATQFGSVYAARVLPGADPQQVMTAKLHLDSSDAIFANGFEVSLILCSFF